MGWKFPHCRQGGCPASLPPSPPASPFLPPACHPPTLPSLPPHPTTTYLPPYLLPIYLLKRTLTTCQVGNMFAFWF